MRTLLALLIVFSVPVFGARIESDVVYGMRSGLALLMDVHYPERSNGHGIIFIPGSGWHAPFDYNAAPLKSSGFAKLYVPPLVEAGYTVFVINHRAAPRFHYPDPLEDSQRAVRFVRANAERFGVRWDRLGGVGGSSGGHLIEMLGVVDGDGDPNSPDLVERFSAKLQTVVARAAPSDLTIVDPSGGGGSFASMMGLRLHVTDKPGSEEYRRYREASPIAHVTPDDPPFLLIHGDNDERVPFERSEEFQAALEKAGVAAELMRIPGGGHGAPFPGAKNPPDYLGAMVGWFGKHLIQGNQPEVPVPAQPPAEKNVERNVVFGMVNGGALLMDVYRPESSNGYGILHITGSGWHTALTADAPQQKASAQVQIFGKPLVDAGYTVFAVNHRTAPTHKYSAQLEDVQRAVRFIRHNAARWGIDPERIGGVGGSSGGHLTAMLGVADGEGDPDDPDPVNRLSAKLQVTAPWAPPIDLIAMNTEYGNRTFASWLGMRLMRQDPKTSLQYRVFRDASPITYVSADDAPALMIHGDADEAVPLDQSHQFAAALGGVGVDAKVVVVPGGGHGGRFPGQRADSPDYIAELIRWFDSHLERP